METTTETTPKEAIMAWAEKHGVTMRAEFVPLSRSRNKGEKNPTLNWRVSLCKENPRFESAPAFITTDYSAGCAHCPSYNAKTKGGHTHEANIKRELIARECEGGRAVTYLVNTGTIFTGKGKPILPDFADVLYSLSMDASVIDAGTFEQWAGDYGYDTDSRAAEAIYRACLDTALKMRAALGDAAMSELATATQDY